MTKRFMSMKKDTVIGYRNGIPVVNRTLRVKADAPQSTYTEGKNYVAPKWTIKTAKAELAKHGLVLSHNDGEYRVNKRGGREATAAYTNDLDDAVGTGIAMAKKGAW
jgi:hypothetical protein